MTYDPNRMTCQLIYTNSRYVNLLITFVPLVLVIIFAIFTLLKCYLHFKAYPEDLTKKLLG